MSTLRVLVLGGALNALPLVLIALRPGWWATRQAVTVAQLLWSGLLIQLTGGRVEAHFHIFGSLAFLAFYRDWRVFPTATLLVIGDHVARALWWPESAGAGGQWWRVVEHVAWVGFEEVVLLLGCLSSVRDLGVLAEREAWLDQTNATLEFRIQKRTAALREMNGKLKESVKELGRTQRQLVEASRRAGMAEVATSVLHNVGNALNSLNIAAGVVAQRVQESPALGIVKVKTLFNDHLDELAPFLADERRRHLPDYLEKLAAAVISERDQLSTEMRVVQKSIDHIKAIIAMQQSTATFKSVAEEVQVETLIDDAITLALPAPGEGIALAREIETLPALALDRHKIIEILVNLVDNARHAVTGRDERRIGVRVESRSPWLAFEVWDTGVGISPQNLAKIFQHGFTTRADGHGFGLHGSATSAASMGGSLNVHSDGEGRGAVFTLLLPMHQRAKAA